MANQVLTRNTISGVVGYVPASYLTHPFFSKQLEEVPEGTKSFVPELHKPKDADGTEVGDDAKPKKPVVENVAAKKEFPTPKPASDDDNR